MDSYLLEEFDIIKQKIIQVKQICLYQATTVLSSNWWLVGDFFES